MDIIDQLPMEAVPLLKKYKTRINVVRMILFCAMAVWTTQGMVAFGNQAIIFTCIKQVLLILFFFVNLFVYKKPFLLMALLTLYVFFNTVGAFILTVYIAKIQVAKAMTGPMGVALDLAFLLQLLFVGIMVFGTVTARKYERLERSLNKRTEQL